MPLPPAIETPPTSSLPTSEAVARRADAEPEGEATGLHAGRHHARYIEDDVPLHVISRVFQGRHLLRPGPRLNEIIIGVIGRAMELYPAIVLYAVAFLSNHMHAQLKGPPDQVAAFMGYIKREISRRWLGRREVPWTEALWSAGYVATALPTPESQVACLRYILAQSTKEGLVSKPELWPGVHSARALLRDEVMRGGVWLNATAWTRARDAEKRKRHPRPVRQLDYVATYNVQLTPIEPWAALPRDERRAKVREMLDEIEAEAWRERQSTGRKPLGAKAIRTMSFDRRTALPAPPWFEDRKRMICWADPRDSATRAYLHRYWSFQAEFRRASDALLAGEPDVEFPPGAFRPSTFTRSAAPPN